MNTFFIDTYGCCVKMVESSPSRYCLHHNHAVTPGVLGFVEGVIYVLD